METKATNLLHDIALPEHICEPNEFGQCTKGYMYICNCCGFGNKHSKCSNEHCFHYKYNLFIRDEGTIIHVNNLLEDEDFEYLFEDYSNFEKIEDEIFHQKRLNYLNAKTDFESYIKNKTQIEKEEFKKEHYNLSDKYKETGEKNDFGSRIKYIERAKHIVKDNCFAKPKQITDEFAAFLNVPVGSEITRVDATKRIYKYIKDNNLLNSKNKKIIIADENLKMLLKIDDTVELTYFNIQRFIGQLFEKQYNFLNI